MTKIHNFNAGRVLLLFISLLIICPNIDAQSRQVRKAEKHKEKVDRQEEKKYEKSKAKAIKDHYDRQSDATKEQMKVSKGNSKKFNDEKKYGFFEGILKNRKAKKEYNKRSRNKKRK